MNESIIKENGTYHSTKTDFFVIKIFGVINLGIWMHICDEPRKKVAASQEWYYDVLSMHILMQK